MVSAGAGDAFRRRLAASRLPSVKAERQSVRSNYIDTMFRKWRRRNKKQAERAALIAVLCDVVRRLPDDQRTMLILADVEGYSYQDVADIVGVTPSTVRRELAQARYHVREQLLCQEERIPDRYRFRSR